MTLHSGFTDAGADDEHTLISITSTEEEPKVIDSIKILGVDDTNGVILSAYIERDRIMQDVNLKGVKMSDPIEFKIGFSLPIGQALTLKAKNTTTGTNATITGEVAYTIKE